jgi:hypothetical protein
MRKWLAFAVQIPFVAMMWAGCSGDDTSGDAGDAAQDVKLDKKPLPDTGTGELPPGCTPSDVSISDLYWTPPATPNPTACTDTQIADYYTNCLPGSGTSCSTWESVQANADCATCLITQESASAWGPLIAVPNNVVYANIGGCIALVTGDTSSTGCGALAWEASQCTDMACSDNCIGAAFTDYQACTQAARTGTCAPEVNAECDLSDAGAVNAACNLNASTFQDLFLSIGKVFCGGGATDAGTDAATDASTDASTDAATDATTTDAATDATTTDAATDATTE